MEPIRLIYAGPIPNRNHRCRDWRTEWAFSKRCRKTFGELPPAMRATRRAQVTITRVLGRNERLYDQDNLAIRYKALIDALRPSYIVSDAEKWAHISYQQDDSRRSQGPCVESTSSTKRKGQHAAHPPVAMPKWLHAVAWGSLMLAVVALLLPEPVAGTDPPMHIFLGRWIWEHGWVPTTDDFAYVSAGAPFVAHGWLSEVIFYLVDRAGRASGPESAALHTPQRQSHRHVSHRQGAGRPAVDTHAHESAGHPRPVRSGSASAHALHDGRPERGALDHHQRAQRAPVLTVAVGPAADASPLGQSAWGTHPGPCDARGHRGGASGDVGPDTPSWERGHEPPAAGRDGPRVAGLRAYLMRQPLWSPPARVPLSDGGCLDSLNRGRVAIAAPHPRVELSRLGHRPLLGCAGARAAGWSQTLAHLRPRPPRCRGPVARAEHAASAHHHGCRPDDCPVRGGRRVALAGSS
jgi:hypothetical protein